jgi:HAD superfamily hydrolase (TIGR01549 family)
VTRPGASAGDGSVRGYTTILFDLFDTLVRFEGRRLPSVTVRGREVRSSVASLYPIAMATLPGVSLETFYEAFSWSYQEADRRRASDHREIPAPERFGLFYGRLGLEAVCVPDELTDRLLTAHMTCLAAAAEPMPGRHDLLDWLTGRYRLGLVSNFDYTPTVERILREAGLLDRFEAIIVSDAVGWRKPRAAIFETAFACMGVRPRECLFVGDRPEIDVAGAKGVGMDVAWLNPERVPFPEGLPAPDFDLPGLADLRTILEASQPDRPGL